MMPSTTISELDTLFHHLQRRMVESGEWERYAFLSRGVVSKMRNHHYFKFIESWCSYATN